MYASVNMTEKLVTVNTNPSQFLDMHAGMYYQANIFFGHFSKLTSERVGIMRKIVCNC